MKRSSSRGSRFLQEKNRKKAGDKRIIPRGQQGTNLWQKDGGLPGDRRRGQEKGQNQEGKEANVTITPAATCNFRHMRYRVAAQEKKHREGAANRRRYIFGIAGVAKGKEDRKENWRAGLSRHHTSRG